MDFQGTLGYFRHFHIYQSTFMKFAGLKSLKAVFHQCRLSAEASHLAGTTEKQRQHVRGKVRGLHSDYIVTTRIEQ